MDEVLNDQFDRVDAALSTLVESIATYNPSPQASLDLVAADEGLSRGLEELSRHQANHVRILALRAEAEALETQLRTAISTLASLRTELLENAVAEEPPNSHPVPAQEILNYAAKIARYTVPPMYRDHITEEEEKDEVPSSTVPTTAVGTPTVAEATEPAKDTEAQAQAPAADQLPPTTEPEYLRKGREMGYFWTPWPDDDRIRKGNLMAIQRLLDQQKDPWTDKVLTAAEMEAAAQREKDQQEEHERKKREREDHARAQHEERERQRQQAQAVQQQQGGEGAPQQHGQTKAPVAQFGGFDFDDDDED